MQKRPFIIAHIRSSLHILCITAHFVHHSMLKQALLLGLLYCLRHC